MPIVILVICLGLLVGNDVEFDDWGNSPYAGWEAEDYYRIESYDKTEETR